MSPLEAHNPRAPHGDFAALLALSDGEMAPEGAAALRDHVRGCSSCALLLEEVRASATAFGDATRALDAPVPARSAAAVRRRAGWRHFRRTAATAAVLVLLLGGGGYALAQSVRLRARQREPHAGTPAAQTPHATPAATVTLLSVAAPDSLDILIGERRDSLVLRVVRSAGRRLSVAGPEGTSNGGVELGGSRLRIEPSTATILTLVVPRGTRGRILSDGRVVLELTGPGASGALEPDSVAIVRLGPGGNGEAGRSR